MKKYEIRLLLVFAACAGLFCMSARAARLAVVATDTDAGIQSVSDLLGLELSKHAGVEMVERTELDRVLREQNLAAGSLAWSGERMSLGRILKADALVLLRQGRAREGAPQQLDARLVETETGYLLGRWTLPLGQGALGETAAALVPEIGNGLRKLGLGRADRILVSVACVFNSTMADEYFWIENEMPGMLENGLMSAGRIVALERRDLNNLLTERQVAQWEGGELEGAAVILNGDIRLKSGEKMAAKPEERVVEFTLRIRGNDLKELGRVVETGKLKELDELTARVIAKASEMFGGLGAGGGESGTKVEAGMFLDLAKRGGWTWAAEAAHALDVKDKAAANELIVRLSDEACSTEFKSEDPFDLTEIREKARKLARAVELCRACGLHPIKTIARGGNITAPSDFLGNPRTKLDDETIEILKPARQVFRSLSEGFFLGTPWHAAILSSGAFEDPDEFVMYAADLMERTLARTDMSYGRGMFQVSQIIFHLGKYAASPLTQPLLEEIGEEFDPEVGLAAYYVLCSAFGNPRLKKEYARKGLETSIQTFQDLEYINPMNSMGPCTHIEMIRYLLWFCPEIKPKLAKDIKPHLERLIKDSEFDKFAQAINICVQQGPDRVYAPGMDYFTLFPRQQERELLRMAVIKGREAGSNHRMLDFIIRRCEELGMQMNEDAVDHDVYEILSEQSALWSSLGADFPFLPANLLVDGTILWILFLKDTAWSDLNIGLMKFDLRTGRILSFQRGEIKKDSRTSSSRCNMIKWDDRICVEKYPFGIIMFPANPKTGIGDLKDIFILGEKNGLHHNAGLGFKSFAGVGDDLYFVVSQQLIKWNRHDKTTELVAAISKQMDETMPLYDSGEIERVMSAGDNQRLYVLCKQKSQQKIWCLDTASQEWDLLEDGSINLEENSSKCPQGVFGIEEIAPKFYALPGGGGFRDTDDPHRRVMLTSLKSDLDKMFSWAKPDTLIRQRIEDADRLEMESRFLDAAAWGHDADVEELLAQGVNINARDQGNDPPISMLRMAESAGVDINTLKRSKGETALLKAIMAGHTNLAFSLIEKGANITLTNERGTTPLYAAALANNLPIIKRLLKMGADVNMARPNGTTPLTAAAWKANLETVKFLLDNDEKKQRLAGESAILIPAAENPDSDVLKFFLKTYRDVDVKNEKGFTPLALALELGLMENARILLDAGADIRVRNNYDMDILGRCAVMGQIEAIGFCLERGLPINGRNTESGMTPLMLAANNGHDTVMRYLIEHGADIEAQSKEKKKRAVCYCSLPASRGASLKVLMEADADITSPCEQGTPISYQLIGDAIKGVLYSDRQLFEKYARRARK